MTLLFWVMHLWCKPNHVHLLSRTMWEKKWVGLSKRNKIFSVAGKHCCIFWIRLGKKKTICSHYPPQREWGPAGKVRGTECWVQVYSNDHECTGLSKIHTHMHTCVPSLRMQTKSLFPGRSKIHEWINAGNSFCSENQFFLLRMCPQAGKKVNQRSPRAQKPVSTEFGAIPGGTR